jgi:hypothetical protein
MKTLDEVEAAVDALPPEQTQELLLFVAARLRLTAGPLPELRSFSHDQMNRWMADDEADLRRFRAETW